MVDRSGRRARAGAPSRWATGIAVSVKPKRGEGLGAIGRAEGIAVWAVALLDARLTRHRPRSYRRPAAAISRRRVLRIYDTAGAREGRLRASRRTGAVSMYVCGPTPYDVPHLGHGRTAVAFDTIRRYLRWRGYAVTYVSNVTDVEDKIIARAAERGTTEPELARAYEDELLGAARPARTCCGPTTMPHATEFIDADAEADRRARRERATRT